LSVILFFSFAFDKSFGLCVNVRVSVCKCVCMYVCVCVCVCEEERGKERECLIGTTKKHSRERVRIPMHKKSWHSV